MKNLRMAAPALLALAAAACHHHDLGTGMNTVDREYARPVGKTWSASIHSAKGAGLDVFADEPHIPAPLLAMDNVVLLPHVGSATNETRKAMGDLCKANLDSWFAGKGTVTLIPELAAG